MRPVFRFAIGLGVVATVFIAVADRRDPYLWAYLALFAGVALYALLSIDDDLAKERFTPPTSGADALSLRQVRLMGAAHVLAGILDSRFKWTSIPDRWRIVGLVGFALGFLLFVAAMKTNRFFSAVGRIQDDRGHHVVDRGAYSWVRHPGYAGMISAIPFSGLALGSWLSAGMGVVMSALILRRV